jgi:ATP-dependent helicase/nuclease subunit B
MGWPVKSISRDVLRLEVASVTDQAFVEYAAGHGTGYALLWDIARETLTALACESLQIDEQEYRDSGYRPIAFEVEAEGRLEGCPPEWETPKLHGRLDRVDRRDSAPTVRVVDYKFKPGKRMDRADCDLTTAGLRAFRLQPPLYALMGIALGPVSEQPALLPEQVEFRFLAPRWEETVTRSTFDAELWHRPVAERLKATLKTLLEGLRGGRYVMLPGEYCDHCEFAIACRRFHGPSWWRAQASTTTKALRALRRQRLDKEDRMTPQEASTHSPLHCRGDGDAG